MGTAIPWRIQTSLFCPLSAQSSTPSVAVAGACSCASSQVPTSQLDTESVASQTATLKRDLENVETQLRGLADRRVRVEAELLRITCEETLVRRQQRRLLRGIFTTKTVRMPTRSSAAVTWKLPPARRLETLFLLGPLPGTPFSQSLAQSEGIPLGFEHNSPKSR